MLCVKKHTQTAEIFVIVRKSISKRKMRSSLSIMFYGGERKFKDRPLKWRSLGSTHETCQNVWKTILSEEKERRHLFLLIGWYFHYSYKIIAMIVVIGNTNTVPFAHSAQLDRGDYYGCTIHA